MLSKEKRVNTKNIEEIFKKGSSIDSPSIVFRFIKTSSVSTPQISFLSPKNIAKSAVERNSLRRRGYTALHKHIDKFPTGLRGVFVFKKKQDSVLIIENEIKNILNKIH